MSTFERQIADQPLTELLASVLSLQVWAAKTSLVGSSATPHTLEKPTIKRRLAEQAMELVLMRFEEDSSVRDEIEGVREQCVELMVKTLEDPKFQPQLRFEAS